MIEYRKGDIFLHKKKGTIAIITHIDNGTYSFIHSQPQVANSTWDAVKNKPLSDITNALDRGFVVLYRPYNNFLDEKLFEVE